MDIKRLLSAIGYFLFSRHSKGHGIHSPFVYDLIKRVLRSKTPLFVKRETDKIRDIMSNYHASIPLNDLGAGSAYTSSPSRKIAEISRHSSVKRKYGRVLYNLAAMHNGSQIVEFGTSLGISTIYIALGAPDSEIITVDADQRLTEIARDNLKLCDINNVSVSNRDFDEWIMAQRVGRPRPSMVFIDGNHRAGPVMRYFSFFKELIEKDSVIIFDDIYYSPGMKEAWNEIKNDSQVSVSIDIFRMGLVFFREGIEKQHFVIRY